MGRRNRERKARVMVGLEPPFAWKKDAELWDFCCTTFPDPVEVQVTQLAEEEGVIWRRIIDGGLRFFYQSEEQMSRFRARMAAIGQVME
jgi:hypothetical protein